MALLVGADFTCWRVGAVSFIAPWQGLLGKRFATAIAFETGNAFGVAGAADIGISLVALFQVFNGNFVRLRGCCLLTGAGEPSRLRLQRFSGQPDADGGYLRGGRGTLIGLLLGDSLLVPVTEVGSMAAALAGLQLVFLFYRGVPNRIACHRGIGMAVSALLILMKLVPAVPGHFTGAE